MVKSSIKTVLLVEDNPGDALLLRRMFREEGFRGMEVVHVESMREAKICLAANAIDIVLLDLGLPDAHGLDALRQARIASPHMPLVVLSGLDDDSVALQAMQEGAQDYLTKGQIEPRELLRAMRYAVERKVIEETLFTEKERAQVTLDSIGDGVVCADIEGNITFLNLVAETLTGWSFLEVNGRPIAEVLRIFNATTREVIPDPMERVMGDNRTEHLPSDSMLVRRDDTEVPIEDSVSPIRNRERTHERCRRARADPVA